MFGMMLTSVEMLIGKTTIGIMMPIAMRREIVEIKEISTRGWW